VVILEWAFRDGTGVGLARRLRALSSQHGRKLVVVIVSFENEPEGFRVDENVDEYLVKPVYPDVIEEAFAHHVGSQ